MAGLIAALFGGKARPPDPNPLPGIGGRSQPPGPMGQTGYPGSTSTTRTFPGRNPRQDAGGDNTTIKAETNYGFDQGLTATPQVRKASFRGDIPGAAVRNPRLTSEVATPQPLATQRMQNNSPTEFFGGQPLQTRPGSRIIGINPLSAAQQAGGHSVRDTETPPTQRQPVIGTGTPGAQNVRNQVAQRYKYAPGQAESYQSAARPDQAPVNPSGQASDGNVHPERVRTEVVVQSRFVFPGGGNQTWSVEREMPYGGRGDGARGADLNGQRYYGAGQSDQFFNGGQGDYGIARERGGKRPVGFTQPAPWTANFYDTTDSVGDPGNPNPYPSQAPDLVYTSPSAGRASNSTGRTG
jgi:hypothetical protein